MIFKSHRLTLVALALLTALTASVACQAPGTTSSPLARKTAHAPRTSNIDVEHYFIDIELQPSARTIQGSCDVRFYATEALERVELDLVGLQVSSVRDAEDRPYYFDLEEGVLTVYFADPVAAGDIVELSIEYGGAPLKGLWFSGDEHGEPTQVFTQGECEDSRYWFPCWDFPSDRATSEVRVTMPSSWTSVAAGERVDASDDGQRKTEHWRMTTPHPVYLTTLVAGEFAVQQGEWDGIPLTYLTRPEHAQWAEASFEMTGDALAFLSDVTGKRYPYTKYSQACVDNFPFGGMENISATTLTEWTLADERGNRDRTSTGLVVHEAAHQWFGDLLTCNDWSHIWLNEGFATYMTLLYQEATEGHEEFLVQLRETQERYLDGDRGENRRPMVYNVYREPMDLFGGGHAYQGGAARLHLLRFVLGDEAFFRGIRQYVADNQGRGVVTEDLRRSLEEASGQDLSAFFDQWFYKPGFPEFDVAWSWDERTQEVKLTVEQTQVVGGGTPAVFRLPVDVEVRTERGSTVHRLELDRRRNTFELASEVEPVWVLFDRFGWIPKELATTKQVAEWRAIAEQSDDVNARRTATLMLGKRLLREPQELLVSQIANILRTDSNHSVRKVAAEGLAAARGAETRRRLMQAAAEDEKAAVRVAALRALEAQVAVGDGGGEDAELARFAREQYEAGYSWATMGACAGLLRVSDPEAAFEWIVEAARESSPHGRLRAFLMTELADVDDERVLPYLRREIADESRPEQSRMAAVRPLGRVRYRSQGVYADLVAVLETDHCQLRRAAIQGLRDLDDPRAAGALRDYYPKSVLPREKRLIEEILRRHR